MDSTAVELFSCSKIVVLIIRFTNNQPSCLYVNKFFYKKCWTGGYGFPRNILSNKALYRTKHEDFLIKLIERETVDKTVSNNFPLIRSAEKGLLKIVQKLCEYNEVDISAQNSKAFRTALKHNRTDILKVLTSHQAIGTYELIEEKLQEAVKEGNKEMVEILNIAAFIDDIDNATLNSLFVSSFKNIEVTKLLATHFQTKLDPCVNDNMALKTICVKGDFDLLFLLLNCQRGFGRWNFSVDSNLPIRRACQHGQEKIVKFLLRQPTVDATDLNNQALILAASEGHHKIVRLLATWNTNLEIEELRLIPEAKNFGEQKKNESAPVPAFNPEIRNSSDAQVPVSETISKVEIDRDALGNKFMVAYKAQPITLQKYEPTKIANVNALIKNGELQDYDFQAIPALDNEKQDVDVSFKRIDASSGNGEAIRSACIHGHYKCVKALLLFPKIDPTVLNNFCLRISCSKGHKKIVKLLLKDDRISLLDENNEAIRQASYSGHTKIVQMLIDSKKPLDPSACDNFAFKSAVANNHIQIANLLLEFNSVTENSIEGSKIAIIKGNKPMLTLIISKCSYLLGNEELIDLIKAHKKNELLNILMK